MYRTILLLLIAILATGCNRESPDARLTRVTEQALAEQAAQNQRMADLELQVQAQSEQLDQRRNDLERQRQDLANARVREPLIANALLSGATLLVAAFPLVAVVLLLSQLLRQPPAADVSEALIEELATDRLRLTAPERTALPRPSPQKLAPPELPGPAAP